MNNVLGLYEHNLESFKKVKNSFDEGNNVVGIVHATGTGKSYNALELAYENKDKKILYVVPSNGIIEHVKKIIDDNPNVDLEKDFPNLEFRTYQSFINLSYEEISEIDCDLLILDEFHHLGAPVWGARINTLIETHQDMKVFGMTAYTVRDRGTSYERDMALEESDELFSNKIVSRYDLCDAMIDGILPKPIYKSTHINLLEMERDLEERVNKLNVESKEYKEYIEILNDVKRRINDAPSIPSILKKNVKTNGKYIYFCPPFSQEGANDIETIKQQALEWFKSFVPGEDIVIYTSTSEMRELGVKNRDAFYNDVNLEGEKVNNKLRVMFAINQYNEGIHAPNIDGVIMGRGTSSDIVYFEQLGRALSVRGNTKEKFQEYEILSKNDLINLCFSRDILIDDSLSKEEIIEKLIAPVVIDLTDNYSFIKELENNLRDRIKEYKENGLGNKREIKLSNATFDIEIENHDLYEMLLSLRDKLQLSWMDYYELAKKYYEHHGDLLILRTFKTMNGYEYDEDGVKLGMWLSNQRNYYDNLSFEQKKKFEEIGFVKNTYDYYWMQMYELAKKYYEHHGNLSISNRFKTMNGYEYDEDGIALGMWISTQRKRYEDLSVERRKMLEEIGFVQNAHKIKWLEMYSLAKKYYEHYGDLVIPQNFKTLNGYEYNEKGIKLGVWLCTQRKRYSGLSVEQKNMLESIGFDHRLLKSRWLEMYELAKEYYNHYNNLLVPQKFKTVNGYEYDENGLSLGIWLSNQRRECDNFSDERKQYFEEIGFVKNAIDNKWIMMYKLAKEYYKHYGNLLVPSSFVTTNGYEYDKNGFKLGVWIIKQRERFDEFSLERKKMLEEIGLVQNSKEYQWQKMYNLAKKYYDYHGNLLILCKFLTINGYEYDESGVALGKWIAHQRNLVEQDSERGKLLTNIGMIWNIRSNSKEVMKICNRYNIDYDKNKLVLKSISVEVLQSKIKFLLANNMCLVNSDGKLDKIFSISSVDMKERFGVTLEELINEYYKDKERSM